MTRTYCRIPEWYVVVVVVEASDKVGLGSHDAVVCIVHEGMTILSQRIVFVDSKEGYIDLMEVCFWFS